MGLRRDDPKCPFIGRRDSSVYCSSFKKFPEECITCGWHPEEHRRRVELLRSGQVKTFLVIDREKIDAAKTRQWEKGRA